MPIWSAPKRATSFGVFGATAIITTEIGSSRTAAPSGEYSSTPCRYWASRKNVPNMAKNTSVMPPEDTAKRGFWNSRRSSIGWRLRHSHRPNASSTIAAPPNHSSEDIDDPAVVRALDDGVDERAQPDDRQQRADRVERRLRAVLRLRHEHPPGDQGDGDDRQVDEEHRAPPEVLEQQARGDRPDGRAAAGDAGPDGDRLGPLPGREDVGQDRQRRRHDERRTDAHHGPGRDEHARAVGEGAERSSRRRRRRGRPAARPCGRSGRRARPR